HARPARAGRAAVHAGAHVAARAAVVRVVLHERLAPVADAVPAVGVAGDARGDAAGASGARARRVRGRAGAAARRAVGIGIQRGLAAVGHDPVAVAEAAEARDRAAAVRATRDPVGRRARLAAAAA